MNKNRIIKILIIIMTIILIIITIYSFITIKIEEKKELSKEIKIYLNETYKNIKVKSKSPIYGLLNYNFDNLDTVSTNSLIYTNFMSSNQMAETEVDYIYKGEFGVNKDIYIKSNKYVNNPNTNCYYHQNILKNEELDCKNICSKNTNEIIKNIKEKLNWTNILPEDIKVFCVESPQYSLEKNGYFVDIIDLKNMYKDITNKELILEQKILDNQYYKYDAYLETESLRLDDNIDEIININSISKKANQYSVDYEAKTDTSKILKGNVVLEKDKNKFYIISNKIGTNNYLN